MKNKIYNATRECERCGWQETEHVHFKQHSKKFWKLLMWTIYLE